MPHRQDVVSETVLIVSLPDKNQAPNETLSGILVICPSLCAYTKHGMYVHIARYTPRPQVVEVINNHIEQSMHAS